MFLPFTDRDRRISAFSAIVFAGAFVAAPSPAAQSAVQCEPAGTLVRVPELPEGSGLAASRRTPGHFWSLNDSGGEPVLVALDQGGRAIGRVRIEGADNEDWESVAVGRCRPGWCIYVGDIGDNDADRDRITVYRIPEPAEASASGGAAEVFHATYPDGAHNAESLLIAPDGRLHIVTKGDTGPVSLYRFPSELRGGTPLQLERVGEPRDGTVAGKNDRVTDGAVSPNGKWIVLRSRSMLTFYRAADFFEGKWHEAGRMPLTSFREPQGEGVTFGSDSSVYLMSEGRTKKQAGGFARLTCTLNP
jgi:hypothetical protein